MGMEAKEVEGVEGEVKRGQLAGEEVPLMVADRGSVNAFLTAALTRVMHAAVSIPAVVSASVLHSAAVGGSVVGIVGPL